MTKIKPVFMPETPSIKLEQSPNQANIQRLMMLPQMQQALSILQMPVLELQPALEECLNENPLVDLNQDLSEEDIENEEIDPEEELNFDQNLEILEKLDQDFRDHFSQSEGHFQFHEAKHLSLEHSLPAQTSLYEHLLQQAKQTFYSHQELQMAEILIGNLDHRGLLQSSWSELTFLYRFPESQMKEILAKIQTFEPYGIGATSIQESLLIQLEFLKKENSLASKIVRFHYQDLLHNRLPIIKKSLKCTSEQLEKAISQILRLDLNPAGIFDATIPQVIIPDLTLRFEGAELKTIVNEDFLPPIKLNDQYINLLKNKKIPTETKKFINKKIKSLKWLLQNISHRSDTLYRIGNYLAKKQSSFLSDSKGKLVPLNMKTVAEGLQLHESTINRAVSNKYMDCPRGIIPLKDFFSFSYKGDNGINLSSSSVKSTLIDLIKKEDKLSPLSDEALSLLLQKQGMPCSRRTVAKYRSQLNIGNAYQRRHY